MSYGCANTIQEFQLLHCWFHVGCRLVPTAVDLDLQIVVKNVRSSAYLMISSLTCRDLMKMLSGKGPHHFPSFCVIAVQWLMYHPLSSIS